MICSVGGCDRPLRSARATLCNTHYFRVYRNGAVGPAEIQLRGRPKVCVELGCTRVRKRKTHCEFHARRIAKGGSPDYVRPHDWYFNPAWKGQGVGYVAAHDRVASARGLAKKYSCVRCGRAAKQWAYTHDDPNELRNEDGIAYSGDPMRYEPMCVPCHKRFDLDRLRAAR